MLSPSTTVRMIPITKEHLKSIIEEKMSQFGFIGDDEHVFNIDVPSLPESFMIEVTRSKKKEVEVVRRNRNGT